MSVKVKRGRSWVLRLVLSYSRKGTTRKQVAAVEAVLYVPKEKQTPVGSLGIVVSGDDIAR